MVIVVVVLLAEELKYMHLNWLPKKMGVASRDEDSDRFMFDWQLCV